MKYLVVVIDCLVGREEEELGLSMYADLYGVAKITGEIVEVETWRMGTLRVPSEKVVRLAEIPEGLDPLAMPEEEVVRMLSPQIFLTLIRKLRAVTRAFAPC